MLRVRPCRDRIEGEEGGDFVFCFLLLSILLDTGNWQFTTCGCGQ